MKFNFWRWLGVVLLIIGIVVIYERKRTESNTAPTQPVTHPTTQIAPATQGAVTR